jgi:predicted small lipoprotein YifL
MTAMRWTIMALCLAALAAGASCGRKGDPKPPAAVEEPDEDKTG